MSRRRARRFTRGNKELVWTAVVVNETLASGATPTFQSAAVVAGTDWFGGAGQRSATLLRIRGWLAIQPITATALPATVDTTFMYIAKFVGDESAEQPEGVTAYTEEEILWTGGAPTRAYVNGATDSMLGDTLWSVDVKAKRKMTQVDSISLVASVLSSAGTRNFVLSGVLRGLVQLS